jgi:hypothetical protein
MQLEGYLALQTSVLIALVAGERLDIERVTSRSEGSSWKSTCKSNSLAAYPTARSVLRGRGDSNITFLPNHLLGAFGAMAFSNSLLGTERHS